MADVDTSLLSAARTGDRFADAVTRFREAAAYALVSDPDAAFAAVGHFAGVLKARFDKVYEYLEQVESSLHKRLAPGGKVSTKATRQALGNLKSSRTVLGRAIVDAARADIVLAADVVAGTTVSSLREEMTGIREALDPYMIKTFQGVQQFFRSVAEYDQDIPEQYLMQNRAAGVVTALEQADLLAKKRRYEEALDRLSVAAAGLVMPAARQVGYKSTPAVTLSAESALTQLVSSRTYPVDVGAGLDLTITVRRPDGVDGTYILPIPAAAPTSARTGDLAGGVRFHGTEAAFVSGPYPVGGDYDLTIHSGTAVITGDLLVDATTNFITDVVRVSDAVRINPGGVEENFYVLAVIDSATLLLSGTPVAQMVQTYAAFTPVDLRFRVGNTDCAVTLDIGSTPLAFSVVAFAALFGLSVAGNAVFSNTLTDCTVADAMTGRVLLVQPTSFYDRAFQAGVTDPPYYADGAANNYLGLKQGAATDSITFSTGLLTSSQIRTQLLGLSVLSDVEVDTDDGTTSLRLLGSTSAGSLELLDVASEKAASALGLRDFTPSDLVSAADLDAAWEQTFIRVEDDGLGHAVMTVEGATAVDVIFDPGSMALGFSSGVGTTSVVKASGLVVGDALLHSSFPGGMVRVISVRSQAAHLSDPIPGSAVTLTSRLCGGAVAYQALVNSVQGDPNAEFLTWTEQQLREALNSMWDSVFRLLPSSDRSFALKDVQDVMSIVSAVSSAMGAFAAAVPRVDSMDSVFFSLKRFNLDMGEWYLAGLMVNEFFFAEEQDFSSSSALVGAARRILAAVNARRE